MSPLTQPTSERGSSGTEREAARRRLQAKRDLRSHLVAYVVVNVALVAVWATTGAGYFWPAWVITFWGAGLILHLWNVYLHTPITDSDIDAELHHQRH